MDDVAPKQKTTPREKIGYLVCLLGTSERGERASAWGALERLMRSEGVSWTDIGTAFGEGKFTEADMHEFAQAQRAEGVADGIKIGMARASNGGGNGHSNGHMTLPPPKEMAQHCHDRLGRGLEDKHRDFISRIYASTQSASVWRQRSLSPRERGYLASLYIQSGGKT